MKTPTIRALYVDDEPVLLEVAKAFLELEEGIELTVLEKGAAALEVLASDDFDVVISDYQMPEMDGLELLKLMKASGCTVPFILFTGKGREEVAIQAINNGADFYLQKGGDPSAQFQELRNAVIKLAQKRAAEKALQESERKYRELVENANSLILRIDLEGRLIFMNECAQQFFGYSSEEIIGRSVLGTIIPSCDDLGNDLTGLMDNIIADPSGHSTNINQNVKKNGERAWVAWTNKAIERGEGRFREILSIGTDMTALHQTEEKLKSSVSLLKATLESTTDGLLVINLEQDVVAYNRQFLEMFRLPPSLDDDEQDLLDEMLEQLKDPWFFQEKISLLAKEPEMSSSDVLEFVDGRTFEMATRPQRSEDGIIGRVWSFHDITGRRNAEEALRASESRLRAIFENSAIGIALVDPQGGFLEVNPAMELMTGYSREELIALTFRDITHPGDLGKDIAYFDEMMNGLRDGYKTEKRLLRRDGTEVNVRLTVSAVRDPEGRMRYDIGLVEDLSEMIMVEDALKVKQEELAMITANTTDLITRVDLEGRIVYASPSVAQVLGYSPEEMIGKTHLEIVHPAHQCQVAESMGHDLAAGGGSRMVARYLRRDGRYIWLETRGAEVADGEGSVCGAVLSSRDISEAMAAETALREREERLRLIADNMKDVITQVDRHGTILYSSPSVRTVLGFEPESRLGQDCCAHVHPEDRERVRWHLDDWLRGGSAAPMELRYQTISGNYRWLETVGSQVGGADGQVEGLVLSSRDVTERREAEEVLYDTERKFRDIFDHANDAMYIIDRQGNLLEVNKVACQRLGYTYRELVHMNMEDFDGRYRREEFAQVIDRLMSEGQGMLETVHVPKGGGQLPVEVNCTSILFGEGTALLCIARDVSERKEAERRLMASEHLLQQTQSTAHIGGYHIDLVAGTSEWTDEAFRICGIDPIKERSKRDEYLRLVLPQDREMVDQAWWEMPERDERIDFVYRLLTPDGRVRHIHNRGKIELDAKGNVVGIFGTIMDVTDLKETEGCLRESQRLLAEAQKLSRTGSYRYDLRNWEVQWSEEMYHLFAMEPGEGAPSINEFWTLLHRDDLHKVKEALRRAVETSSTYDITYRVMMGREFRFVHSTGKVMSADDRTPSYMIGTLTDITEKVRAEEERERMERRFREIFDSANDIMLIIDPTGRLLEANRMACRRLSYSYKELLESTLVDIVEPSHHAMIRETFARIMSQGELVFESCHLTKGGQTIPVELSCKVVDIGGRKTVLSVARDITERKEAERRLMESRGLLSEAEKTSKMGSFRGNIKDGTIQLSEEAYHIHGLQPKDSVVLEDLFRMIHPEDLPAMREQVELIQSSQVEGEFDYRIIMRGGAIKNLHCKMRPHVGHDGTLDAVFGTIMDVTDRKRAEDAAKLAELKIALLGDITRHDVQNKVTALSGYLQLAEMRSNDKDARELIAKARLASLSIAHQMSFTQEYQTLGQNEAHWMDLMEACRKGAANLDLGEMRMHAALDGYEVFADPMLEKVFHNLVENSVRYGRTATSITISASVTGSGLRVVFQDDGVGIADEDREGLFDWEFRGRRGHGLHLIREVLRISGMSIKETGESGKGSRFEILVPPGRFRAAPERCRPPSHREGLGMTKA